MLTVKRIYIEGGRGTVGDTAYSFVDKVLKRRYGNSVTFALDFEAEEVIAEIKKAGFNCGLDGYEWNLSEPSDFVPGKMVYVEGDFGMVKVVVKELVPSDKRGIRAKVNIPNSRKQAVFVSIPSQEEFEYKIRKEVGLGGLERYQRQVKERDTKWKEQFVSNALSA